MHRHAFKAAAAAAVLSVVVVGMAAAAVIRSAGPQPDGTAITPQGWRVTPAGSQTDLGLWPMDVAMSPAGNLLLVANAGYAHHSLMAIDPASGDVLQTISAAGAKSHGWWDFANGHPTGYYVGLAFSPDGRHAWASDGPGGAIHVFRITGRSLTETQHIKLAGNRGNQHPWPAGIAVSGDGNRLYVAGNLDDTLRVVDPTSRAVLDTIAVGHLPYGVALNQAGTRAFVSNWGGRTVSVISLATRRVVRTVTVGTHPCAIVTSPTRNEIYVANGDSDSVSVLDATSGAVLRTIDLRPYANAPVGGTPDGLAVSPDGSTLYVTNAGDDDVAVVRLASGTSPDHVAGLIPTAWYPSGVAVDPTGTTLFAINMKGLGAGPHLDPTTYWPAFMGGTLSRIPVPNATQLAAYTDQVAANDRFGVTPTIPAGSVIPAHPGDPTPITHVIYVMKENRTYDQILGDLGRGNGDPSLSIFGEDITPNQHELARRFVTFDNFYADAEVSADGWSWTTGGYANGYIQRNWPVDYNGYGRPYDFGGFGEGTTAGLPGEHPGRGFLWDEVARAGISYRNFGFFMDNPVDLQASIPGLLGHTDPHYPGWDMSVPDQVRIDRWLDVFQGYQQRGSMPTVQFVYLPRDHTAGTTPRCGTPRRDGGGQRPRLRAARRGRLAFAVLGLDRDLRRRGRRAGRSRPRRRPPFHGVRDQPVHADRVGRLDVLFVGLGAAHDRADPGPAADEPVRRGGQPDDGRVHVHPEHAAVHRAPGEREPEREEHARQPDGDGIDVDRLLGAGQDPDAVDERDPVEVDAWRAEPDARTGAFPQPAEGDADGDRLVGDASGRVGASGGPATGRRTSKTVPPSAPGNAVTSPPCAATIA